MRVSLRSFAKINFGLRIGPRRPDGFHDLLTIYQTIALHDIVDVEIDEGAGIEIHSEEPRVPTDDSNTCWKAAQATRQALQLPGRVKVFIHKQLPLEGGLGAASSNAAACITGIEWLARRALSPEQRRNIAAEVGSDVPLFLTGGTMLGTGRGEVIYPLADVPTLPLAVVTPGVGVSTPKAFAAWDQRSGRQAPPGSLTGPKHSDRIKTFSHSLFQWLRGSTVAGVLAESGDRVEGSAEWAQPLLDLVRTGIENDFEKVVFPEHPELFEVKHWLYEEGAEYASLSGSGSSLYGVFASGDGAEQAAEALRRRGLRVLVTRTLGRKQYQTQRILGRNAVEAL